MPLITYYSLKMKLLQQLREILPGEVPYTYKYYSQEWLNRISTYTLLSIIIYMGLHPQGFFPYWSTDFLPHLNLLVSIPISRSTFSSILTLLQKWWSYRLILQSLGSSWQHEIYLQEILSSNQHISVDDWMVKKKRLFTCKQHIRMKPTKCGFNLWILCDASNGYTWNLSVYHGNDGEKVSTNGLSCDVVIQVVEGLRKEGYIRQFLFISHTSQRIGQLDFWDCVDHGPFSLGMSGCSEKSENKDVMASVWEGYGCDSKIKSSFSNYGKTWWYVWHLQFTREIRTTKEKVKTSAGTLELMYQFLIQPSIKTKNERCEVLIFQINSSNMSGQSTRATRTGRHSYTTTLKKWLPMRILHREEAFLVPYDEVLP